MIVSYSEAMNNIEQAIVQMLDGTSIDEAIDNLLDGIVPTFNMRPAEMSAALKKGRKMATKFLKKSARRELQRRATEYKRIP